MDPAGGRGKTIKELTFHKYCCHLMLRMSSLEATRLITSDQRFMERASAAFFVQLTCTTVSQPLLCL
jgi:hypothetical protein